MISDREWLENLKEGDAVVVRSGYVYYGLSLDVVERVTPTQVIVRGERGLRFRKSDGEVIGGDNKRLIQPTAEVRGEIRKAELVALLGKQSLWRSLPLDTLEKINELLPKEGS